MESASGYQSTFSRAHRTLKHLGKLRTGLLLSLILLAMFELAYLQGGFFSLGKENTTQENMQNELKQADQQISELKAANERLQATVANLTAELNRRALRRPTSEELQSFLREDKTNLHPSNKTTYNCVYFASDLKRAAAAAGWNISYVEINYVVTLKGKEYGYGHAMNGAYLANGTWVWIEPQTDTVSQSLNDMIARIVFLPLPFKILTIGIVW